MKLNPKIMNNPHTESQIQNNKSTTEIDHTIKNSDNIIPSGHKKNDDNIFSSVTRRNIYIYITDINALISLQN